MYYVRPCLRMSVDCQAMDRFTSPVFLSVNERGELQEGLGGVPDYQEGHALLFVGNHQLLGIDLPILVRKHAQFFYPLPPARIVRLFLLEVPREQCCPSIRMYQPFELNM